MSYQFQGTVQIQEEEFWEFAANYFEDEDFHYYLGSFEVEWDKLYGVKLVASNVEYSIPGEDFWEWVHDFFPNNTAETRCSNPEFKNECIEIKVVMGDSSPDGKMIRYGIKVNNKLQKETVISEKMPGLDKFKIYSEWQKTGNMTEFSVVALIGKNAIEYQKNYLK